MAALSDWVQVLLLSFVHVQCFQCLFVDMGTIQHWQIQGVASLVLCKVSKKCSYQDTGMSLLFMLTYYWPCLPSWLCVD